MLNGRDRKTTEQNGNYLKKMVNKRQNKKIGWS